MCNFIPNSYFLVFTIMTPEEQRNLLKEQYKKELREKKQFLEKVEQLKKQQPLLKAIEGLKVEDDSEEWMDKLNQETAFMEAKTELAMDAVQEQKKQLDSLEHKVALEKLAAEQLIIEMKRQMGLLPPEEIKEEKANTETSEDSNKQILGDF